MNGTLVARRRLRLGLSRTDLARLTGLSWDLIASIEERGEPPALTLDAARRLASALAVDLNSLAAPHGRPEPKADDVALEALLAHADRPLSTTELAATMHWNLERTRGALTRLEERLSGTGQSLRHATPGRYELAARGDLLPTADLERLRRCDDAITTADAALLRRLIVGRERSRCWEDFDADQRAALARLAERGLVEPAGSWVILSMNARFNLEPDLDRSGPNGVQWPLRHRRALAAE